MSKLLHFIYGSATALALFVFLLNVVEKDWKGALFFFLLAVWWATTYHQDWSIAKSLKEAQQGLDRLARKAGIEE